MAIAPFVIFATGVVRPEPAGALTLDPTGSDATLTVFTNDALTVFASNALTVFASNALTVFANDGLGGVITLDRGTRAGPAASGSGPEESPLLTIDPEAGSAFGGTLAATGLDGTGLDRFLELPAVGGSTPFSDGQEGEGAASEGFSFESREGESLDPPEARPLAR